MRLFVYEGYNVTISPEALTLKPFRTIWKRDRSDGKQNAQRELAYIYFMMDARSDYLMHEEAERHKMVCVDLGLDAKWKPDAAVKAAMEFYGGFKPESARLLDNLRGAITTIRGLMDDITSQIGNIRDVNDKLQALEKLTSISTKLPKLATDIADAEKKMAEEMKQQDKVRGGNEKGMLEDE